MAVASLQTHRSILNSLTSSGAKLSFLIGWFSVGDSGEIVESVTLRSLTDLGISLDINVYCCQDEQEAAADLVQDAHA